MRFLPDVRRPMILNAEKERRGRPSPRRISRTGFDPAPWWRNPIEVMMRFASWNRDLEHYPVDFRLVLVLLL